MYAETMVMIESVTIALSFASMALICYYNVRPAEKGTEEGVSMRFTHKPKKTMRISMIEGQINEKLKALASKEKKLTEHEAMKVIVDRIWPKYDTDKSG